jgi:hypothetical protein
MDKKKFFKILIIIGVITTVLFLFIMIEKLLFFSFCGILRYEFLGILADTIFHLFIVKMIVEAVIFPGGNSLINKFIRLEIGK